MTALKGIFTRLLGRLFFWRKFSTESSSNSTIKFGGGNILLASPKLIDYKETIAMKTNELPIEEKNQ